MGQRRWDDGRGPYTFPPLFCPIITWPVLETLVHAARKGRGAKIFNHPVVGVLTLEWDTLDRCVRHGIS